MPTRESISRRVAVWDRSGGLCHYCGKELHPVADFTVDHVLARISGGTDDPDNLVAACRSCNARKATKDVALFFATKQVIAMPSEPSGPPWSLRELRARDGISQAALADRLGVDRATIGRWETSDDWGVTPGKMAHLALAYVFGVDPETIELRANGSRRPGRPRTPDPPAASMTEGEAGR
jgi:DNA-binding XRE family transcriptional regulator